MKKLAIILTALGVTSAFAGNSKPHSGCCAAAHKKGMSCCSAHSDAAPAQASAEGNAAEAKSKAKPYPLTTCIVSDEKLGGMGEPAVFVHKGQEIKLCCKSCRKKFDKDPAGYLKKLEPKQ